MAGTTPGHDGQRSIALKTLAAARFGLRDKEKWRRGNIAAPSLFTWRRIRRLELHRHAAIDGRFGAGVGALTGCRNRADAGHRIVIEAELVLPVAVGNPEVDEVRVFRADKGLAGVKRQTDRLAVEFGLRGGGEPGPTWKGGEG